MLIGLKQLAIDSDIIVSHGHVYIGTVYAAIVAKQLGKPLILIQHSPSVDYPFPVDNLQRLVDRTVGKRVIRSASHVVAVSRFTEKFVHSIAPGTPTVVVHSGVDTDRFSPGEVSPGQMCSRPIVLTVRRLVPRNGVDILVRAWCQADLGKRATLVIVGEGPERSRIARIASEDSTIVLAGRVSESRLPDLYRLADIFVLPSRSGEGFGLVLAEAMASGLPVVATRSGGVVDLVEDNVNGRLVEPGRPDRLASAVGRLVDDRSTRERLRLGALTTARDLSWDRSMDRFEEALSAATW